MAEGFDRKSSERLLEQAQMARLCTKLSGLDMIFHAEATTANFYKDPMKEVPA